MAIPASQYVLGHSESELQRLIEQAAFFGELTAELFRKAGLRPGMRVLDVGSGVGDVAFLAASLVGPTGSVLGIDRSEEAVNAARERAARAGAKNVAFEVADAVTFRATGTLDAVVGRLFLAYQSDPAAVLRHLAAQVEDGGMVAFHECDLATAHTNPPLPLFTRVVENVVETFRRANLHADMGARLHTTFREAGLSAPRMIASTRVESGDDSGAYAAVAKVVGSAAPIMERLGVATIAELQLETLEQRLRDEVTRADAVVFMPLFVGAWTNV
ncbi:MAG TPA: methyltransferase domain-containing protein [Thermoanaerobaculia bacterium]|nr:methyltransferase domain-containing protein [Thermoanaerobaculia bacterium]